MLNSTGPWLIEKIGTFVNPVLLNFKNENNQLLVFYFHGLFESERQKELKHIDPQNNMTVTQFVNFIEYFLEHKFNFIKPEDLHTDLRPDQRYAMITFDDGYFNNMLAYEVLNRFKIPACIFIATRNITENTSFWWDIIYKYRAKQGKSLEAIRKEQRTLKSFKYSYINNYIVENFGNEAFKPWSDIDRPFTAIELKKLAESPYISIGNHTHNHSILTNYTRDEILEELSVSNAILSEITGTLPISTAFPNGNYNNLVVDIAREVGFRYAFTVEPGRIFLPTGNNSLVCLNRYMSDTTKINKFGGFCRLGYEPESLYNGLKAKMKSLIKR